jgi:site-specific DNA-methyltransferase (adenine-specific)
MEALASRGFAADSIVTDPPYGWSFMNRDWDSPDSVAFRADTWRLALQLLPPGGMLAAFGGARSHHRLMCAVEDAGFEIFDVAMWLHGQGAALHKSRLKPAYEPIVLARKRTKGPVRKLNIDDCRIATDEKTSRPAGKLTSKGHPGGSFASQDVGHRAIVMTSGGHAGGRWPANILHSGEPEILDLFASFGEREGGYRKNASIKREEGRIAYGAFKDGCVAGERGYSDTGTAARFFFTAKASKSERAGSKHPCIKPQALLRWLIRLITPPGGVVLDCFAGAGSTGMAALAEGRSAVLIEREAEHVMDARRRLGWLESA